MASCRSACLKVLHPRLERRAGRQDHADAPATNSSPVSLHRKKLAVSRILSTCRGRQDPEVVFFREVASRPRNPQRTAGPSSGSTESGDPTPESPPSTTPWKCLAQSRLCRHWGFRGLAGSCHSRPRSDRDSRFSSVSIPVV